NNQTIVLPQNSVSLNGSGSKDNDGSITEYSWSKISGPSSASIETPDRDSTNVTGLAQGTYTFELKVTDNQGAIGRDTVTIIVNENTKLDTANHTPISDEKNNQTIVLPQNSVSLNGSASNDNDGSITEYSWSKISGPSATIETPDRDSTNVTAL